MMRVGGKHFLPVFLHKDRPWGCAPKGTYYQLKLRSDTLRRSDDLPREEREFQTCGMWHGRGGVRASTVGGNAASQGRHVNHMAGVHCHSR